MEKGRVFREPQYVPTKWLAFALGFLGIAFILGMKFSSIDSRISASEASIRESGSVNERMILRLNSIDNRLSNIEGRLGVKK